MATYEKLFDALGLREWCDADKEDGPMSMAQLLAQTQGTDAADAAPAFPFPSLDVLHEACHKIGQTRDVTEGLENAPQAFLEMLEGGNFGKQLVRVGEDA